MTKDLTSILLLQATNLFSNLVLVFDIEDERITNGYGQFYCCKAISKKLKDTEKLIFENDFRREETQSRKRLKINSYDLD